MISAKIIADSIYNNHRITTLQLRYPRFIHSEFMTHRVFSRNASSSRAIPVKRLIKDIRSDPALPIHWGENQTGMQARYELPKWKSILVKSLWLSGMYIMTTIASLADKIGCHKQVVNRLIEPWSHINVLVTSTEWNNFFELRCHPDAQPEIQVLANLIREEISKSSPIKILNDSWHMPYVSFNELNIYPQKTLLKISVARCARVSYLTTEGKPPSLLQDLNLFDRLIRANPFHASPCEHQAIPLKNSDKSANFVGWEQLRSKLEKNRNFLDD